MSQNEAQPAQGGQTAERKRRTEMYVVGVLGALAIGYMALKQDAPAAQAPQTVAGQDPYTVREFCLTDLRKKLKAPATARFEDKGAPAWNGQRWSWASYVDAENSFGANLRTSFTCEVYGSSMDDAMVRTSLLSQ